MVGVSAPSLSASPQEIESLITLGCFDKAAAVADGELSPSDPLRTKAFCRAGFLDKVVLGDDTDSLEELCWAYLHKGRSSTQLLHRWISLQLAADLHSYRSVPFVLQALQDSNIALRQTACGLVSVLQDQSLVRAVKQCAKNDNALTVRLAALDSLSAIQAKGIDLLQFLNEESVTEEKIAILGSLALLRDKVDAKELKMLVASNRALLRLFAVKLAVASGQKELISVLMPLLNDNHPLVKMAFFEAAVILKQESVPLYEREDSDYRVAITAAWMKSCYGASYDPLVHFLRSENAKARALAAVALGKLGVVAPLQAHLLKETDPFVRLNCAEALLSFDDEAGVVLFEVLSTYKGPLMMTSDYSPALPLILPSELPKQELISDQDVDYHDLMVRMTILQQLACKNRPEALSALKGFLKEKRLGKATLASFVLLQEGDEETARMVQQLLYDSDEELSLQAALLLGTLFSDSEALFVLKSGYDTADLETRLKIIEALGRIGDKESVPFLQKQLKDPSLLIQLLASWAIITIANQ